MSFINFIDFIQNFAPEKPDNRRKSRFSFLSLGTDIFNRTDIQNTVERNAHDEHVLIVMFLRRRSGCLKLSKKRSMNDLLFIKVVVIYGWCCVQCVVLLRV